LTRKANYPQKIFDNFDPFIFGLTYWQTLMTNWWYNVGRDLLNHQSKTMKYWYDYYIENLGLGYLFNMNKNEQIRDPY
jgi:hypothetical protein